MSVLLSCMPRGTLLETEQKICVKAWGGHNITNALIGHALRSR